MAVLFKGLNLYASGKSTKGDFVFDQGILKPFHDSLKNTIEVEIQADGWHASSGWIDLRVMAGEPGLEYKETLETLSEALAYGGFSHAVLLPNTEPTIQSKTDVDFVKSKSARFTPELIVQGAVTKDTHGEDFTEILDMHYQSGVKVFGDGIVPLSNSDRFLKAIQYLQKFDGILFDHSYDPLLAIFGQMHEGEMSTHLGMKGIPSMAEEVAIHKNLELIRYAGGRVHFQTLSTKKGVELIRQAKAEGLSVTSDVSLYQLLFTDSDLAYFDPNYKVKPPFRGEEDRLALLAGLQDGTIDAIVSNHQPQDFDAKFMEFDLASFGMAGLQAFLPGLVQLESELGWELLLEKITKGPEDVLQLKGIETWTIFDPSEKWKYDSSTNKSLASNHPWFGQELQGKVKYVIQKGQLIRIDG